MLLVDGLLLATLASQTFGAPPEAYLAAFSGTGSASATSRLAAKLGLAWEALREALFSLERPTGEPPAAGCCQGCWPHSPGS